MKGLVASVHRGGWRYGLGAAGRQARGRWRWRCGWRHLSLLVCLLPVCAEVDWLRSWRFLRGRRLFSRLFGRRHRLLLLGSRLLPQPHVHRVLGKWSSWAQRRTGNFRSLIIRHLSWPAAEGFAKLTLIVEHQRVAGHINARQRLQTQRVHAHLYERRWRRWRWRGRRCRCRCGCILATFRARRLRYRCLV